MVGVLVLAATYFVLTNPRGPLIWVENPPGEPTPPTLFFPVDLPDECSPFDGDYCALFSCLQPGCWCSQPEVLAYGSDDPAFWVTEETAWFTVDAYLKENGLDGEWKYEKVVELNDAFYNVFVVNSEGSEEVYSVAKDGAVIKTECGV